MPPVRPMLAKSAARIPADMLYEAKWDGFRALVFRDGGEIEIASRSGRPFNRYFPELVAAFRERLPERCVLDGEIVVARGRGWTSTPCWSASIRPTPGCGCSRSGPRRAMWPSTCWPSATARCSKPRSGSGARRWSPPWRGG